MLMRSTVAAIDFNYNIGRKSKIGPDGKPRLRTKVIFFVLALHYYALNNLQVDRTGTKATVVEQKESKDYSFMTEILDLCVACIETGQVPDAQV